MTRRPLGDEVATLSSIIRRFSSFVVRSTSVTWKRRALAEDRAHARSRVRRAPAASRRPRRDVRRAGSTRRRRASLRHSSSRARAKSSASFGFDPGQPDLDEGDPETRRGAARCGACRRRRARALPAERRRAGSCRRRRHADVSGSAALIGLMISMRGMTEEEPSSSNALEQAALGERVDRKRTAGPVRQLEASAARDRP